MADRRTTPDALVPNDPRAEDKFFSVGDVTYHYILAKPEGKPVATVVLVHGWPDLGMGWRFQVPLLLSMNLEVIVPDMLGYGRTSAPEPAEEYSMKKVADHLAALIKSHTDQPIILGGHDWGGFVVWRLLNYHPELIRGIFSLCVPYLPPSGTYISLEDFVKVMPNFTYQLQLASPAAENLMNKSRKNLENFINGMYGGRTPDGKPVFELMEGVVPERIEGGVSPAPLMTPDVVRYYVDEFSRNGLHGPCNWYRTRKVNAEEDAALLERIGKDWKCPVPALLVLAELDGALPPRLADGQEKYFAAGLKKEIVPGAGHWVQTQKPEESNKHIRDFIKSLLGDELKATL